MDTPQPAPSPVPVPYSSKRVTKFKVSEFSFEMETSEEGSRVFALRTPCPCEDEDNSKLETILSVLKQAAPVILDKLNQILAANGIPTGTPPIVDPPIDPTSSH